ncbi:solute carrier family 46 member 3 isoform X2 [Coccinella septempunctata]|nr:solute carrier family 46 member 3 isoform X2 [Coccinella septempunctata]XP_044758272.1 solute carrier family 46 member 3 isoform X2 [Coccinella septempunctata]XP_044758273.1 solute carrier family 46 member 3 isoform X2 [Coccinella septempunctata]
MPLEWNFRRKACYYLGHITVEPTLYLYMMAFMITSVLENAFFIDKACRVNHHFNSTVCDDIANEVYSDLNKEVQVTVSNFNLINDIAGHTGQIILALFMGAWSDKRGRKMPLLLGLIGKFYYSSMVVVNSMQPTWPVEYVVYTATLPMAFTGADVAIFAAAFSYLVDVSSSENRTLRVTLLEVIYLSTMPTGIALGSYLYRRVFNKSYTMMFSLNAFLMFLSIVYTFLRLRWRTTDEQSPLPKLRYVLCDFLDYNHVVFTFRTIFQNRLAKRRRYLMLLILMMGLYTFQRDEKNTCYLYLQNVFHWSFPEISNFSTFKSAFQDIGLIIAIPLMSRVLGWRDTIIVMIGAFAHTAARIFFILADTDFMFYTGGAFAALGPIVAPVIRSMVSKIVAVTEKGAAFSILSVADNAIPIISGVMYSKLYNFTINSEPQAIFFLTMATQLSVLITIVYIHFTARLEENLVHTEEKEEDSDVSEVSNA